MSSIDDRVKGRKTWSDQFEPFTRAQFEAVGAHMNEVRTKRKKLGLGPKDFQSKSVQDFHDLIYSTPLIRMNLTNMIDEVPGYYKEVDEAGNPIHGAVLVSIDDMLAQIDAIVQSDGPAYNETGLVGFPINQILNWTMGVPSGSTAFQMDEVNAAMKAILDDWYKTKLETEVSKSVFTTQGNGWCSPSALARLNMSEFLSGNALESFENGDFNNPAFPYGSWAEFFIRPFLDMDASRPVAASGIASPCESHVYAIQTNVKLEDWFWVKARPYSLRDLLRDNPAAPDANHLATYVEPFVGGTVYQAFLAADKYHRWHSPVTGTIKDAYVLPGTYYSAALSEGLDGSSPDLSQGYIAHTATRAVFFIEADDPKIGLFAFCAIGMAEVSSCRIRKGVVGEKVQAGEEIGYFQYGGSTSVLVFRAGVISSFDVGVGDDVLVRSPIAQVS